MHTNIEIQLTFAAQVDSTHLFDELHHKLLPRSVSRSDVGRIVAYVDISHRLTLSCQVPHTSSYNARILF